MYYLAGYLWPAGIGLLFDPTFALKMLGNNQDFGDTAPRLTAALILALGVLVIGIIRRKVAEILPYTVAARLLIIAILMVLGIQHHNPLFFALDGIVGLGVFLTLLFGWMDRRDAASSPL